MCFHLLFRPDTFCLKPLIVDPIVTTKLLALVSTRNLESHFIDNRKLKDKVYILGKLDEFHLIGV